jgi:hypothetical protein
MVEGVDDGPLAADSSAAESPASHSRESSPRESPSRALLSPVADSPESQPPESELSWPDLPVPSPAAAGAPTMPPPADDPAWPSALESAPELQVSELQQHEIDSIEKLLALAESASFPIPDPTPTPDPTERELGFREPVTEEVDSEVTLKPKLLSPVIVKEIARRESEGRVLAAVVPPPKLSAFSTLSSSNVAARPVIQTEETETLKRQQPAVGPESDEITKLDHEAQLQALEKVRLSRFPFPERIVGPRPPSLHDDDESGHSLPLDTEELFDGVEAPRKVGGTALLDLITPRRYAANSVLPRDVSVFIKEDSLEALPARSPSPPSVVLRALGWLLVLVLLAGLSYAAFILGEQF